MGGKNKQANRTKNNTRPSSSSHSAELLGNTIPTFFGFSSVKTGVSSTAGFPCDDSAYSINSDFQVLFKLMNKKDPITRFKALQQFVDTVNNIDAEEVKAILPLWPRTYCMLCTDVDHKVRETSHKAHKAVVAKVKKLIAPYLKELAGPWFTSQYDTYAPAATAATAAFEEAFPSPKVNRAIAFCQEEILSYIYDNLINQTPQTLCHQNIMSPEDMKAKYERTILASLQGYSLYLQKLSSQQIEEALESNKKLLSNSKFWKYAKNKAPLIRCGFFQVLISLCQNAKFLLANESSRVSNAIFNELEESDPVVLQSVWDAALNVLVSLDDCWSHVNIEKQLCTKLYSLLKGGGRNASTVYPNILPLLSKIPKDALKDKKGFYENLFESMKSGFEASNSVQSSSDGKIMANTFTECLKFIIKQNASNEGLCLSLVINQLIPVMDKLLIGKSKAFIKMPFFFQVSNLLQYWKSNHLNEYSVYDKLANEFFHLLLPLCEKQINDEVSRTLLNDVLNNQVLLLNVLLSPDEFRPKSKGHVKFEEEGDSFDEKTNASSMKEADKCAPEELVILIKKLATIYFVNASKKEEKNYLIAFSKIVRLFDAKIIFDELIVSLNESTCFKLFSSHFSKWLMRDDMKCRELMDLSFMLLKYVAPDEKEYILEEFCGNWLEDSLRFEICRMLPNYSGDECIMKWVKSEKFIECLLGLIRRFVEDDTDHSAHRDVVIFLLKAKNKVGEFIIDGATIDSIMDVVSQKLESSSEKSHAVELSRDLILNAEINHLSLPSFSKLVTSLFKLSCYATSSDKLLDACFTGLGIIISARHHDLLDFTKILSEAVRNIILSDKIKYSLEQIVDHVSMYLESIFKVYSTESYSVKMERTIKIIKLFLEKSKADESWNSKSVEMLEKCCHVGHEGNEKLDFEYLEREKYSTFMSAPSKWEKNSPFDPNTLKKYVKWNLYVGRILNLIPEIRRKHIDALDECNSSNSIHLVDTNVEKNKLFDKENRFQNLLQETSEFLLCACCLERFNKYHAGTKFYKKLREPGVKLKDTVENLIKNINSTEVDVVFRHCNVVFGDQSIWWILKPTFDELFEESPENAEESQDLQKDSDRLESCFDRIQKMNISKLPLHRGNYLMISFLQDKCGHRLTERQWDQIFIYLHKFVEEFLEKPQFSESDLLILLAVSRLYLNLRHRFKDNHTKPSEKKIPPETCLVWNEVVESEVYIKIISVWRKLARTLCMRKDVPPEWVTALQNIADVVVDGLNMINGKEVDSLELAIEASSLMKSPLAVIQITSFRVCLSTVPYLVKLDTEVFGNNMTKIFQDGTKTTSDQILASDNWSIKNFENEISENQTIVETLLSDFIIGDNCTVEPFTDSFSYTYSYLLLWCFLLNACAEAHSSLRMQYGSWLQESGYTSVLLESVFKLMPQSVIQGSQVNENCQKFYENYDSLDFREPISSQLIEQIACFVYRLFLQRLPNYVREWWKQVENKTSSLVDNVTKNYVSPILIANELKNVKQDRETGFDNIEVKTYPCSREVVATYIIDEVKMDLIMTLPPNYPLGTAKIESSNVVVGTSKWRNLLFQICKYLIHQNGTIWDALFIWKNNLDKKFEGVEECYICFSILQGSTFEIPRLCCHTCKKKFHSNCLYKWFSTSNNSTCPICRNLF